MDYTIKDVARIAGVSIATASMALNGKPGPKEETRSRVLEAAKQVGYTPNASARTLIKGRSGTIGLVVTDITNPFFGMLTDEINRCVSRSGYSLSIGVSGDEPSLEAQAVMRMMEQRAEGVIIVPSASPDYDLSHLYALKNANIPFVFSTSKYAGIKADCVMCDLQKGSYMLTEHLLSRGHKRIVIITGQRDTVFSSLRVNGCRKAFKDAGMEFSEEMIIESFPNYDGGYSAAKDALCLAPDAVMTINDQMAMGVISCFKKSGVAIPDDVSVAGYDDLLYTSILETPLTTVRQPVADIAGRTVETLISLIGGTYSGADTLYVDPVLKIRETTR